jgi:hypothetical protein
MLFEFSGGRKIVADCHTPFGTVFFVLPFQDFFYSEIPDVRGIIVMDYPKTPAANITYGIASFKDFFFDNTVYRAVKMHGLPVDRFGNSGGYFFDWFAAPGTGSYRKGKRGRFRRNPLWTFNEASPFFLKLSAAFHGEISGFLSIFGRIPVLWLIFTIPAIEGFPAVSPVISTPSAAAHCIFLPSVIYPLTHCSIPGQYAVLPHKGNFRR